MKKRKKENQNPFRNFELKRMVHYPKVCKVVARTSILFARKLTPEKDVEKEQCKLSPSGQPIRRTELLPSNIFVIGNLVMASPVNSDEILIAPVLIRRAISQQPPFILPNMHQVLTRCAAINLKKKLLRSYGYRFEKMQERQAGSLKGFDYLYLGLFAKPLIPSN